jgi:hypothetical protein
MQPNLESSQPRAEHDTAIDPMTLARLDIGLFRNLLSIGTPRQRICSTFCLSATEYDYITRLLQQPS